MIAPCGTRGRKLLVADGRFIWFLMRKMDIGTKRFYDVLSRGTKEARVYSGFQDVQGR